MLVSLFNKVANLQACNFFKNRLQHKCFSVNIAKSLRTPILKNIFERLESRKIFPPICNSFCTCWNIHLESVSYFVCSYSFEDFNVKLKSKRLATSFDMSPESKYSRICFWNRANIFYLIIFQETVR